MTEIQVDDLQYEGEMVILRNTDQNQNIIAKVLDVVRGDRSRVELCLENNKNMTMILKQKHLDDGDGVLFRLSKEDDPEYYL